MTGRKNDEKEERMLLWLAWILLEAARISPRILVPFLSGRALELPLIFNNMKWRQEARSLTSGTRSPPIPPHSNDMFRVSLWKLMTHRANTLAPTDVMEDTNKFLVIFFQNK